MLMTPKDVSTAKATRQWDAVERAWDSANIGKCVKCFDDAIQPIKTINKHLPRIRLVYDSVDDFSISRERCSYFWSFLHFTQALLGVCGINQWIVFRNLNSQLQLARETIALAG
jgi:hypothetical protein